MIQFPSISIITCSFNSDIQLFTKSLIALHKQDYPKKLIQHLVIDGGSTNSSDLLAKKFGSTVLYRPDLKDHALERMRLGILKAKGDLILFLEPDNIMIGKRWLRQMVQPFLDNNAICATYSVYNTYEKQMPAVTRYSALIGVNDPLVYYLGKSEKLPRFKTHYDIGNVTDESMSYYTVRFDAESLPTLGDNGHMVRTELIKKEARRMERFLHTDAFANMCMSGHDTYGVVKNMIIHYTGSNLISFFSKRAYYKSQYFDRHSERTYRVFHHQSKKDVWNVTKFIFFSFTLFQTVYFSIRGYVKIRDLAWFLHPVACILEVFFYTRSELKRLL